MTIKNVRWEDLIKLSDWLYEIPQSFRSDMRAPARLYMSEKMFASISNDRSLVQLVNTATLPGIVKYALAMPDIHQGYGFPIGGVVATSIADDGIISPGGIGYDINCGVRLLTSNIAYASVKKYLEKLADALYEAVPSGVGRGGKYIYDSHELTRIMQGGATYMFEKGYGELDDLEYCEERGNMAGGNPELISKKACERGSDQLGTLGSGNHFLEVQYVDEIFDEQAADAFGLRKGMLTVMIHCGSRGLGHQVCTDFLEKMVDQSPEFGYQLPDRELVCVPFKSSLGQDYFAAMVSAANFAWANRHMIAHSVRHAWQQAFGKQEQLKLVYDISHNIGKREMHTVDGKMQELLLHRKGATRSFGPGRPELPHTYQKVGQPVLIPGTMGTASYVLSGTEESMAQSFGSCCHGAGRTMSRMQAKKKVQTRVLLDNMHDKGIVVRCDSSSGLAEEAPLAYKDVHEVVNVVHNANIARKVARLRPIVVIKGG